MSVNINCLKVKCFELFVNGIYGADVFNLTVNLQSVVIHDYYQIIQLTRSKDVSFMENNAGWHGKAPNDEEYATAMADLDKISEQLEKAGEV